MVSCIDTFLLNDEEMEYLTTSRKQENGITISVSRLLHMFKSAFPDYFVKSGFSSYTKTREIFAPLANMRALLGMRLSPYLASQSSTDQLHTSISPIGMPKSKYFMTKLRDIVFKYYLGNICDFCVFKPNGFQFKFVPFNELFDVFLKSIVNNVSDVEAISFVEDKRVIHLSMLISSQTVCSSIKVFSGCRFLFNIVHHIPKKSILVDSFKNKFESNLLFYREEVELEKDEC